MPNGDWIRFGPVFFNKYPINAGQVLSIPVISANLEGGLERNRSRVIDVLWEAKTLDESSIIPVSLVLKKVVKDSQQDIHEKVKVEFYNNSNNDGNITIHFLFESFFPNQ
nr:hypothetical protein [Bacillus subtilis]